MLNGKEGYQCGLIGCIGNDDYGNTVLKELQKVNVNTILEITDKELTSRCGCGIFKKERCLMPQIRASNKLTMSFIEQNLTKILENDILFIEGYFLIECWDIVKFLYKEFKKNNKKVAFTLSAVFMVEFHFDKIKELAEVSDIIFSNEDEARSLAKMLGNEGKTDDDNVKIIHEKLSSIQERLLIVTCGKNPVILSKYNYEKKEYSYFHKSEVQAIPDEQIVDTNGCGDSFVGGFMSQYLQNNSLENCAIAGNYAASVIIKNIGCTFPDKPDFKH